MNHRTPLRIDIISDIVCPWCFIGYRRLEQALQLVSQQIDASIHWHPFILNRDLPEQGRDYATHLMEKYDMSVVHIQQNRDRIRTLGVALGITFDYYNGMFTYNTLKAHQLLQYADTVGQKSNLKLRLMHAHFSERKNISNNDTLISEAINIGLNERECLAVLADSRYADAVLAEEQTWIQQGVNSVPTYVFNRTQGIAGAQDPETLANIMRSVTKNMKT